MAVSLAKASAKTVHLNCQTDDGSGEEKTLVSLARVGCTGVVLEGEEKMLVSLARDGCAGVVVNIWRNIRFDDTESLVHYSDTTTILSTGQCFVQMGPRNYFSKFRLCRVCRRPP